jgi:hypothetical protein
MKWRLVIFFGLMSGKVCLAQMERYAVVINEIMADPSPVIGLPNAEYIELRNNSSSTINLNKWRIDNGTTTAVVSVNYLLAPDSLVILCSRAQAVFFNAPSKTLGLTSFPALTNDGDLLTLTAPDGKTIHAMSYDINSYGNAVQSTGGWSLEMIDPRMPCNALNWRASTNSKGGTPGIENSVYKKFSIDNRLQALQCTAINEKLLLLTLNQGADSVSLAMANHYQLSGSSSAVINAKAIPPLFNSVEISLNQPLETKRIYLLKASPIKGCNSNKLDSLEIRTGLAKSPEAGDLVINEILFDPPTGGADFIELHNPSTALINVRELMIGSRNATSNIGAAFAASEKDHHLFPGDFLVLSEDTGFVKRQWPKSSKQKMIAVKSLPSFPDDKGNCLVMNKQGKVIDELNYTDDMHYPLLTNKAGVSLERVDPRSSSSATGNWHSASSDVNHATPGWANSQFRKLDSTDNSNIRLFPSLISPDNDGQDDLLNIQYQFNETGTLLSAYVFNQTGQLLSTIIDNRLCGISGSLSWNGFDAKNNRLPEGVYVVLIETFNLNGKTQRLKKAIGVRF